MPLHDAGWKYAACAMQPVWKFDDGQCSERDKKGCSTDPSLAQHGLSISERRASHTLRPDRMTRQGSQIGRWGSGSPCAGRASCSAGTLRTSLWAARPCLAPAHGVQQAEQGYKHEHCLACNDRRDPRREPSSKSMSATCSGLSPFSPVVGLLVRVEGIQCWKTLKVCSA